MRRRLIALLLIPAIVAAAFLYEARSKPVACPASKPADVTYDFVPAESVDRTRSLPALKAIEQSLFRASDEQLLAMLHGTPLSQVAFRDDVNPASTVPIP